MSEPALFDLDSIFDDDYLYFYETVLSEERTAKEIATVWTLLSLNPASACLIWRAATDALLTA